MGAGLPLVRPAIPTTSQSKGGPSSTAQGFCPTTSPDRLHRLKERSGLSWNGLAEALGVDIKQVLRWRDGTEPCGGAMLSILGLSAQIPSGVDIFMGEGFLLFLVRLAVEMPGGMEILVRQGFQLSFEED